MEWLSPPAAARQVVCSLKVSCLSYVPKNGEGLVKEPNNQGIFYALYGY